MKRHESAFTIELSGYATLEKTDVGYVAIFLPLDVGSQGDTAKEARENLKEALIIYLEECIEAGILSEILNKYNCGKNLTQKKRETTLPKKSKEKKIIDFSVAFKKPIAENIIASC